MFLASLVAAAALGVVTEAKVQFLVCHKDGISLLRTYIF